MKLKILVVSAVLSLSFRAHAESGEAIFKKNCIMCHGADGKGQTKMGLKMGAADLTSNDIQSLSDAALAQTIHNGKSKMPPFSQTLSDADIAQVVQYIRTLRK